jgi:hypothetical protein
MGPRGSKRLKDLREVEGFPAKEFFSQLTGQ